jgi:hypothetical protein
VYETGEVLCDNAAVGCNSGDSKRVMSKTQAEYLRLIAPVLRIMFGLHLIDEGDSRILAIAGGG